MSFKMIETVALDEFACDIQYDQINLIHSRTLICPPGWRVYVVTVSHFYGYSLRPWTSSTWHCMKLTGNHLSSGRPDDNHPGY